MSEKNVEIVRRGYDCFSRGDIEGLLALFDDAIEWESPGPKELPTAGTRRGKQQVAEFFQKVDETFELTRFEPQTFLADGDRVVVLGEETSRIKATGTVLDAVWAHAFTLKNGKVVAFQEYMDTSATVAALQPPGRGRRHPPQAPGDHSRRRAFYTRILSAEPSVARACLPPNRRERIPCSAFMTQTLVLALLIGIVAGMRTFTAPAAVSWAASLGCSTSAPRRSRSSVRLDVVGAHVLALAEFVADLHPATPSRKAVGPFVARLMSSALSGAAIGTSSGQMMTGVVAGAVAGVVGAVIGTLGRLRLPHPRGWPRCSVATVRRRSSRTPWPSAARCSFGPPLTERGYHGPLKMRRF